MFVPNNKFIVLLFQVLLFVVSSLKFHFGFISSLPCGLFPRPVSVNPKVEVLTELVKVTRAKY